MEAVRVICASVMRAQAIVLKQRARKWIEDNRYQKKFEEKNNLS